MVVFVLFLHYAKLNGKQKQKELNIPKLNILKSYNFALQ